MITTINGTDTRTGQPASLRVIPGDKTVAVQLQPGISVEITPLQATIMAAALEEWQQKVKEAV